VAQLVQQFMHVAEQQGLDLNDRGASQEAIQQCVLTAFIDQLAKRRDAGTLRCDLVHGRRGELERESAVRQSPLFVAAEINEIEHAKQELTVRLRLATAVDEAWLHALFPEAFSERTEVAFDASGKRVVANRVKWFRDLVLAVKRGETPPAEEAATLLAREVMQGRLTLKQWTPAIDQWIFRLNNLAQWCPELRLPAIGDEDRRFLLQQICLGSYSAKDIRDQPVWPWLKDWLSPGQEALIDQYAPAHLTLPNGRRGRIRYAPDAPPLLSARIQDLYDLHRTPTVAMDRQLLLVEVLGPNQRPLQVTQDLAGFWQNTYPELKRALQKRYPKHEWR
jgi:ATP-dependent helicase HrpB